MVAPTNPYSAVTLVEIQAGKPCKQELKEKFRSNNLNAFDVLLAAGVSPGDAAVAVGHKHLGPAVDGTATISAQPQENLVSESDGVVGFTDVLGGGGSLGKIEFADESPLYTPRRIRRSTTDIYSAGIRKALLSPINKIKSSGGKGRFTCSVFVKREAAASGVVGATLRLGLHDGSSWITGAFVGIDFDDVTTEYKRFYFVSSQIARPAALNIRLQWTEEPSDWDTISNGDLVGHIGGIMVTNGASIAKWDISHIDGGGDSYLVSPTNDITYWWDEGINTVELTP